MHKARVHQRPCCGGPAIHDEVVSKVALYPLLMMNYANHEKDARVGGVRQQRAAPGRSNGDYQVNVLRRIAARARAPDGRNRVGILQGL